VIEPPKTPEDCAAIFELAGFRDAFPIAWYAFLLALICPALLACSHAIEYDNGTTSAVYPSVTVYERYNSTWMEIHNPNPAEYAAILQPRVTHLGSCSPSPSCNRDNSISMVIGRFVHYVLQ